MSRDGRKHDDAFHDELIQNYLENEATPAEEKQFRLLLGEESFRRRVAEYAIDLGQLCDHVRQGMLERALAKPPTLVAPGRRSLFATAAVAASILLVLGTTWFVMRDHEPPRELAHQEPLSSPTPDPTANLPVAPLTELAIIARLADVTGKVLVADSRSQEPRPVRKETHLRSGSMLHTVGSESFALLKFDDHSVVAVAGDTSLTCTVEDSQKRLDVHGGDIMAQVATQPDGKPMVIKTPGAEAEVLGTKLSLFASLALTELAVLEGHVSLRRLFDDQTIDVKSGECAVASKTSKFAAEAISPVPSVWDEDFEQEWPNRWRAGHWIHYGLPPGSTGAVLAASRDEDGGPCFISTPNEWSRGLFRIEDDTHLNLTYKLRWPGWFYVMLHTRTEDYSGAYQGSYMYQTPEIWKIPRNQWRTVSIPLREFHEPQRDLPDGTSLAPPNVDDVVFSLFLRTQEPDPGLVIDRIWVTNGPDVSAELLKTP